MKNISGKKLKTNFSFIIVTIYILLVIYMAVSKGGNLYIPVHDYLDSHIAHYKVLHDNHQFFSGSDTTVNYMGGIDRDFLPSELKMYTLPFAFLEPFAAIVFVYIMRIILSVSGGVYLAKCILKEREERYRNIVVICSFIYGILPSAPVWDLCFAIYPFLYAQTYRLYSKQGTLKDSFVLFAVPFFSELAHFGVFLCGYLLLLIIIDWVIHKDFNKLLGIALLMMSAGYAVSEYRMFRLILLKNAITIRQEFVINNLTFGEAVSGIKDVFLNNQYHCATAHKYVVLPMCVLYFVYLIYRCFKSRNISNLIKNPFFIVMVFILLNASLSGMAAGFEPFNIIIVKVFPFMKGILFENVIRINSFLWYFEFVYILIKIYDTSFRWLPYVISLCAIAAVLGENTTYNLIKINYNTIRANYEGQCQSADLSYNEFYSETLFDKIKRDINYDGEWSAAFGMHPAVLSYNQISTLDGYHSWYTLDYKHRFRSIIAPELDNSERMKGYFDDWGGRAYIFSEEVSYQPVRDLGADSVQIRIDTEAFKIMKGRYIFSRVEISNAEDLFLGLKGIYTDKNSPYTIYVYETG